MYDSVCEVNHTRTHMHIYTSCFLYLYLVKDILDLDLWPLHSLHWPLSGGHHQGGDGVSGAAQPWARRAAGHVGVRPPLWGHGEQGLLLGLRGDAGRAVGRGHGALRCPRLRHVLPPRGGVSGPRLSIPCCLGWRGYTHTHTHTVSEPFTHIDLHESLDPRTKEW